MYIGFSNFKSWRKETSVRICIFCVLAEIWPFQNQKNGHIPNLKEISGGQSMAMVNASKADKF